MPQPTGQQARWLEILEEFRFHILHRAGQRHGNADALSRRPCDKRRCCPNDSHSNTETVVAPNGAPIEIRNARLTGVDLVCVVDEVIQTRSGESDSAPRSAFENGLWTETTHKDGQKADPDVRPVISFLTSKQEPPSWDEQANLSKHSKALLSQWE